MVAEASEAERAEGARHAEPVVARLEVGVFGTNQKFATRGLNGTGRALFEVSNA